MMGFQVVVLRHFVFTMSGGEIEKDVVKPELLT